MPIIFIHPPLLTSANFTYQQAQLLRNFKVITFDIRGHGRSEESQLLITYPLIVEDIKRLMDHLNIDKAVVCGYSTGGSVALEALINDPERFKGGILISAMSEVSNLNLRSQIRIAMGLSKWKPIFNLLLLGISWSNSDSWSTFHHLYNDARLGNIRNIHQYYSYSLSYNCTNRLAQIEAPVFMIYGENDGRFQRYCHILQKELRHVKLVNIDHMKHQLPTKAADLANKEIEDWINHVLE